MGGRRELIRSLEGKTGTGWVKTGTQCGKEERFGLGQEAWTERSDQVLRSGQRDQIRSLWDRD